MKITQEKSEYLKASNIIYIKNTQNLYLLEDASKFYFSLIATCFGPIEPL